VEYCLSNLAIYVHSFHFIGKVCQACDFLHFPCSQKLIKLGTEERQDSLRDMHMFEEVNFDHVVNKCITILKLDFQF
jgi:hypothetical protein